MHIRLQNKDYRNEIRMQEMDPIMGAIDWRNMTMLRRRMEAGEIEPEDYRVNNSVFTTRRRGRPRPQISLPLIHGSIVIMHGQALTNYYEVSQIFFSVSHHIFTNNHSTLLKLKTACDSLSRLVLSMQERERL